ncbi:MAG: ATP-dependent nuclease [Ruminococcaceae bacterium]|nr:ATP-dependent nuclease [Oscillospiraceae bacterium]
MFYFILGRAGSGKSDDIYDRLYKTEGNALMLVPDQFVFEAERIVAKKTDEKTENIKICGFSSLSEEILRKFCRRKSYADTTAKHIIMQDAVKELKKGFSYYSTAANKKGFTSLARSAVEEMKKGGITPDTLSSAAENLSGTLKDKVSEIALIYGLYNEKLTDIYDDREDNLLLAARSASENGYFKGVTVFIDGFDSFSGSQFKFLAPLIEQSKDCYIALCLDRNNPSELNFSATEKTLEQLKRIADNSGVEVSFTDLQSSTRYSSNELLHLRNILSGDKVEKYEEKVRDIVCKMANDADTETDYVFAEIRKLTRKGYRYSDINILCPSPANYVDSITSSALRYEVPVFTDIPSPISRKPLVKYLLFLLETAINPSGKNILRLVKSGFVRTAKENGKTRPITLKEINALQRYCDKWDIGHLTFTKPFSHLETDEEKRLDALRDGIVTPLTRFKAECEGKTGSEITRLFTEYLFKDADISAAIQGKCQDRTTRDLKYNKELTEEYNQLWSIIITMLESADEAMQNISCTLSEYADIIKGCASLISLSKPPQVLDSVLFGDTHRTRSKGAKVVFVIGADENSFPNCDTDNNGVFTLQEYSVLAKNNIDLFADGDNRYISELSACYKALTLPSEKLYITYCGNKEQMGEMVETVLDIFDIRIENNDLSKLPAEFFCESIRSAEKQLAVRLFDGDTGADIKSALAGVEDTRYLELIGNIEKKNLSEDSNRHLIDPDRAGLIFGFNRLSPTAIRSLNNCRFGYFCQYGLGIRTPSTKKMSPQNIGNIVHYAMDYCFKKFYDGTTANGEFSDDIIKDTVAEALAKYREDELMEEQYHTVRFNVLFKNLGEICFYLLKYMTGELARSNFHPSYFELDLKQDFTTPDGFTAKPFRIPVSVNGKTEDIEIYGTVDRVDIATIEKTDENGSVSEQKQIRVIDYKTGLETFGLGRVYYGLSLQLLIYLFALAENNPDYIPSSATYYPSGVACTQSELAKPSEDKLRDIWLSNHPEEGIVVKDTAGDTERENYKSLCPTKTGKHSDYFAAKTVTSEKFGKLKDHITSTIAKNVGNVKEGDVSAFPLCEDDSPLSCTFCSYNAICGARQEHSRNINSKEAAEFITDITATDTQDTQDETAGEKDE